MNELPLVSIAIGLVVNVVFTALALQAIAVLVPGFDIDSWGSALWGAFFLGAIQQLVVLGWAQIPAAKGLAPWQFYVMLCAATTVSLALTSALVGGIRFGAIGLLVAGVLLTVVSYGAQLATTAYLVSQRINF